MYCVKCGNKVNKTAKYCAKCGCPVNGNDVPNQYINDYNQYNMPTENNYSTESFEPTFEEKKRKRNAIIIALLVGGGTVIVTALIVIFTIMFIFGMVNKYANLEYLSLGETEVRNFLTVVDGCEVCGFNVKTNYSLNESTIIQLEICYSHDFEEKIEEYFTYMKNNYDYVEIPSEYSRTIKTTDGNSGYVIEINVDYDNSTIIYTRYYDENFNLNIKEEPTYVIDEPIIPEYNDECLEDNHYSDNVLG